MSRVKLSGMLALLVIGSLPAAVHATPNDDPSRSMSLSPAASSDVEQPEEHEENQEDEDDPSAEVPLSPFSSIPREDVERSLSRALSSPDASFCNEKLAAVRDDPLLCSLSQLSVRQRCPGLRAACAAKPAPSSASDSSFAGSLLGKGLATVGNLVFWLVLLVLLLVLMVALARILVGVEFVAPDPRRKALPLSPSAASAVPRHVGESDVARLWSLAEQSALSSHFEDAVAALQAALIHALRISGKLHVSPAQTNGDYLRALRSDESYGAARDVFRSVEAVQFGGAPASAELYRRLFERVQPIVVRVLSVLLLCAFCFAESGCSNALSGLADGGGRGLGVLTQVLRDQQVTVRRRIRALTEIESDVSAILVVGEQSDEAWPHLLKFAEAGGMLVVTESSEALAKATNVHYLSETYKGRLDLPADLQKVPLELSAVARHALDLGAAVQGEQTYALAGKHPYVAERSYGDGTVLYFGDDEFLSNASLSVGDNALFVVNLLRNNGRVVELVGPWTGGGASSTLSSLTKAGLGALVAQLALLALLFAWHGGTAFGVRRDPVAVRRRAFRDHVLALGESYRRARATRFALATYGSWLIERLRERLSPQQPIGLIDLAGRMAAKVEQPESQLMLLLTEAREAQDDLNVAQPSPADLTTLEKLESLTLRAGASK